MTQAKKATTLSELAKLSGVSLPVVSAILKNKKGNIRYSQETYDKVMKIVELTNYRPNRTARNLRSNRHHNIGILTRKVGSIATVILNMMQEEATKRNQSLIFCEGNESKTPEFLLEDFVDGIVVIDFTYDGLEEKIAASGIPTVWINTGVKAQGAINYNEVEAIRNAVKHLAAQGKRTIAFFNSSNAHYSQAIRFDTLTRCTDDMGLEKVLLFVTDQNIYCKEEHHLLEAEMSQFLTASPQVDAVIMANDVMGAPFYSAVRKLGKTIPDDIAVIGFMNSYIATALYPTLTSLNVDLFETGRKAVRLLNEFIDGNFEHAHPAEMEYDLIIREST